jgi:hypothetical protein
MSRKTSEMLLPNVNLEEMVKVALWNVDYHLAAVKYFNERPGMSTVWEDDPTVEPARKPDLQGEVNSFHAHLRAFFWELVAAFDTMKTWVIETRGRTSGHLSEVEQSGKANWYVEVSSYRNFAHRCSLLSVGEHELKSGKLVARSLISARRFGRQPAVPDGLVEYRDEMHKLFDRVRQFGLPH